MLEEQAELAAVDARLVELLDGEHHVVSPGHADECERSIQLADRANQNLVVRHALRRLSQCRASWQPEYCRHSRARRSTQQGTSVHTTKPAHHSLRSCRI